jgi:hypothetical protein
MNLDLLIARAFQISSNYHLDTVAAPAGAAWDPVRILILQGLTMSGSVIRDRTLQQ